MTETNRCACGSNLLLENCCLPVIQGKVKAQTAEQLLRARYTAFTQGEVDFILSTHHSRTRKDVKREEIEDWAKNSKWLELKIFQKEAGSEKDSQGTLVFGAYYQPHDSDEPEEHLEKSFFERENGEWKFLDAQGIQTGPFRRTEPKVGRNDPCPCGSGKKYKKCCQTRTSL
jgi:SEC-C motif-containing protein